MIFQKLKQWRKNRLEYRINYLDYAITFYNSRTHLTDSELKQANKFRDELQKLQDRYRNRYGVYHISEELWSRLR